VRDAAGLSTAEVAVLVSSVLQSILVARWLGPYASGVVALVLAYPTVVFAVFEPQSSQAAVRYLGEFRGKHDDASALAMVRLGYAVDIALGAVAFLFVLGTASFAQSHIVHARGTLVLLLVYSASFSFHVTTSTSRSVLLTERRFKALGWERAVTSFLGYALSLVLLIAGWRIAGVIWGLAIGTLVDAVALAVLAQTSTRTWGGAWWSAPGAPLAGRRREILRFIAYSDVEGLLNLVTRRLDIVILGFLRGPTDVGYYRIARALSGLPGHLVWPLETTAYQRLVAARATDGDGAALARSRRYALKAGLPLGAGLLLAIPLLPAGIRLTAGSAYEPAVTAAQVLLAGSAVWLAVFWLRPLALTLGTLRFWVINGAAWVVASVAGFFWVTPRHGFLGMAWVYTVTLIGQYAVGVVFMLGQQRHLGRRIRPGTADDLGPDQPSPGMPRPEAPPSGRRQTRRRSARHDR
jgi:O-antigen/teichoic acid export membrane protein